MFHYVVLSTTAYSTEDPSRVKTALEFFLPPESEHTIKEIPIEGHYGNKLLLLQTKITGNKNTKHLINIIKTRLSPADIAKLTSELTQRVDEEGRLHLRFDKQQASQGKLAIATNPDIITVQMKIKAYPSTKQKAIEAISNLF